MAEHALLISGREKIGANRLDRSGNQKTIIPSCDEHMNKLAVFWACLLSPHHVLGAVLHLRYGLTALLHWRLSSSGTIK